MPQEAQTVVRAFAILYCFSKEEPALSVAEIAHRLGLNRTTVHRLLFTLERCHAVQRHPEMALFSLHPHLLRFTNIILEASDLHTVAQEPMNTLWEQTGETVALHLRDGMSRIVFMQVESRHDLRVTYPRIGEVIALNVGAPSKAIVAFLSPHEVDTFLATDPLVAATEVSITDRTTLRTEAAAVRARGYAVSFGERRHGVASIAAPIFECDGNIVAALNVVGPDRRIQDVDVPELAGLVVSTAKSISRKLGHCPGTPHASRTVKR